MAAVWVPLVRLEEIMGLDAAHSLATEYGGLAVYVGKKPSPGLVAACGGDERAAMALCVAYPGTDVVLPSQLVRPVPKKERIAAMIEAGCGNSEIIRECRCTLRYVSEIRRDLGRPDRTRRTPMKPTIIAMLKARRKWSDEQIAEQTGSAVAYVAQLRSSLKRGLI